MTTLTLQSLQQKPTSLQIEQPIPGFAEYQLLSHLTAIYRSYLIHLLLPLLNSNDREAINGAIQRTTHLSSGDLVLVAPRLQINGVTASKWVTDLVCKVSALFSNNLKTRGVASAVCDRRLPSGFPQSCYIDVTYIVCT